VEGVEASRNGEIASGRRVEVNPPPPSPFKCFFFFPLSLFHTNATIADTDQTFQRLRISAACLFPFSFFFFFFFFSPSPKPPPPPSSPSVIDGHLPTATARTWIENLWDRFSSFPSFLPGAPLSPPFSLLLTNHDNIHKNSDYGGLCVLLLLFPFLRHSPPLLLLLLDICNWFRRRRRHRVVKKTHTSHRIRHEPPSPPFSLFLFLFLDHDGVVDDENRADGHAISERLSKLSFPPFPSSPFFFPCSFPPPPMNHEVMEMIR